MGNFPPFEFYQAIQSLHLHFKKPDYDFFRAKGNIRTSVKSFDKRNDAKLYAYAATRISTKDIVFFVIANVLENNKSFIYNVNESQEIMKKYKKRIISLSNNFNNDLKTLTTLLEKDKKVVDNLFDTPYNTHPVLMKQYLAKRINIESMILIDKFCRPFVEEWDNMFEHDPVWKNISFLMKKYSPFLDGNDWLIFDPSKIKVLYHDFVNDNNLNVL